MTGRLPFHGCSPSETLNNVRRCNNRWESRLAHVSAEGKDFVRSLIVKDPDLRPSAESLINHPWIACHKAQSQAVLQQNIFQRLSNFTGLSRFRRACLSVLASSASQSFVSDLRELFLAMSDTGKGAITLERFTESLESMCQVERSAAVEMFELLDEDGDGKVYYTEFLAATTHDQAQLREDVVRRTFDHFDVEGTGFMSLDNVKRVLGNALNEQDVQDLFCGLCEVHENAPGDLDVSDDSGHGGYSRPLLVKPRPSRLDSDDTWGSDATQTTACSPALAFGVPGDGHKIKRLESDDDAVSVSSTCPTMASPNLPCAVVRSN